MALTRIDSSVLANTGVTAGTYGGATLIPYVAVGLDGRITRSEEHTSELQSH